MNAEGYLSWVDYNVSANQDDLIYASQTATGQVYGSNSKVVFTFNHLLSIVGFTFKSGFDADTDLTISNVTVKGVPSTATFTPDNTETAWQYRRQLERSHRPAELLADDRRDHRGRGQLLRQLLRHSADGALDRGILQRYGNLLGRCAGEQPAFHHDGSDGTVTKWDPGYKYNYVATITPESVELTTSSSAIRRLRRGPRLPTRRCRCSNNIFRACDPEPLAARG